MSYSLSDKKAETIKSRLLMGEKYHRQKMEAPFRRALDQYRGDHYQNLKQASNSSRIVINITLHVIETRVHAVAFRYPRFVITPADQIGMQTEPTVQAGLKYYWRIGGVQDELRRMKRDAEIYGTGIALTGWMVETEDGTIVDDGEEVKGKEIRQDRFFAKRIFPGNFLISPECGRNHQEAQWMGYWELQSVEEVKANPHFSNTQKLKGNASNLKSFLDLKERRLDDQPNDVRRVKLYHYYEKARRIHVILTDEHDKPLYSEEWKLDVNRYPFRNLLGPGDEDSPFGLPMTLLIEHPQREINQARSQLSNFRKVNNPKYQMGPGVETNLTEAELKSEDPLVIVHHTSETPAAIVPIEPHRIQPEVYQTEEAANRDIQAIAAVSQYQLGNPPTKRTPTAEVQQISSLGGARAQNDLQAFEVLCAEVAQDCLAWMKKYAIKNRVIPVMGSTSNQVTGWANLNTDSIAGEHDIEVAAHSTAAPNDADQLQSIGFFMQSVMPLLQMIPQAKALGMDLRPILRQMLRALPDIQDADEITEGLWGTPAQGPQQPMIPGMPPGGGAPAGALAPAVPQAGALGMTPDMLLAALQGAGR